MISVIAINIWLDGSIPSDPSVRQKMTIAAMGIVRRFVATFNAHQDHPHEHSKRQPVRGSLEALNFRLEAVHAHPPLSWAMDHYEPICLPSAT